MSLLLQQVLSLFITESIHTDLWLGTDSVHLHHCISCAFGEGRNSTEVDGHFWKVLGKSTVSDRTCRIWLEKFQIVHDVDRFHKLHLGSMGMLSRPRKTNIRVCGMASCSLAHHSVPCSESTVPKMDSTLR